MLRLRLFVVGDGPFLGKAEIDLAILDNPLVQGMVVMGAGHHGLERLEAGLSL